jgi:hypothetical protein
VDGGKADGVTTGFVNTTQADTIRPTVNNRKMTITQRMMYCILGQLWCMNP